MTLKNIKPYLASQLRSRVNTVDELVKLGLQLEKDHAQQLHYEGSFTHSPPQKPITNRPTDRPSVQCWRCKGQHLPGNCPLNSTLQPAHSSSQHPSTENKRFNQPQKSGVTPSNNAMSVIVPPKTSKFETFTTTASNASNVFDPIPQQLVVPINIGAWNGKAIVDTGASYTLLHESLWKELRPHDNLRPWTLGPICLANGRKRRRRRGRRGGLHVKLRTHLDFPSMRCGDRSELGSAGRSRECYRWLRLVGPDSGVLSPCPRRRKTSTRLGHTLDLIISRGVTVSICEVLDFPISDHSLIRFDIRAVPPAPTSIAPQRRRIITSSTVDDFVAAFTASDLCSATDLAPSLCPDLFLSSFHTICSQIMDSVAPYKVMGTKSPSDPWLNDTTRALRRRCRQAECKWKKDRLQVSLEMFRDSLSIYQKAVKDAKGQYLSNLINSNSHRPGILFSTINSVKNPVSVGLNDVSELTCNAFKQYFLDKVLSVRQAIILAPAVVTPSQAAQCVLENFETVTLMDLKKAVHELKATICPLDAVPARIMKEAIDIVGPCLVSFINRCLSLGTVPTALKHAIVRPLLKKSNLDPSILSNFRPISHLPFL
ncbi:hypothetical protein QQF64_034172 [Cirrhinus molitorella]|uniref:Peptidase A2 domain-containing protein n=1 Tax=Cirrhinus molitorella TaxID=172907 RepID=A0ABR3MW02_9TELE